MINKITLRNKKAAANIIVVVLLVLLAITLVAMVGYWIYNFVADSNYTFDGLSLSIDRSKPICYNETSQRLYLSVKRGNDGLNLTGIMFSFEMEGASNPLKNIRMPASQETYYYTLIGVSSKPKSVQISPVLNYRNKDRIGSIVDKESNIIVSSCTGYVQDLSGLVSDSVGPSVNGPSKPNSSGFDKLGGPK